MEEKGNEENFQKFNNDKLISFWDNQFKKMQNLSDFKNTQLPLIRIKKIMKCDEDIKVYFIFYFFFLNNLIDD